MSSRFDLTVIPLVIPPDTTAHDRGVSAGLRTRPDQRERHPARRHGRALVDFSSIGCRFEPSRDAHPSRATASNSQVMARSGEWSGRAAMQWRVPACGRPSAGATVGGISSRPSCHVWWPGRHAVLSTRGLGRDHVQERGASVPAHTPCGPAASTPGKNPSGSRSHPATCPEAGSTRSRMPPPCNPPESGPATQTAPPPVG